MVASMSYARRRYFQQARYANQVNNYNRTRRAGQTATAVWRPRAPRKRFGLAANGFTSLTSRRRRRR